jgi:hypothetical protein
LIFNSYTYQIVSRIGIFNTRYFPDYSFIKKDFIVFPQPLDIIEPNLKIMSGRKTTNAVIAEKNEFLIISNLFLC